MLRLTSRHLCFFLALVFLVQGSVKAADEPSVDSLLKKLPPPEKLVKSPTDRVLLDAQALVNDRTVQELGKAVTDRNFSRALQIARTLAAQRPDNAVAHCLHGVMAFVMHQYGEAAQACHRAIALRSNYGLHLADEYRLAGRPRDAQQAALRAESLARHSPNGHKKQS